MEVSESFHKSCILLLVVDRTSPAVPEELGDLGKPSEVAFRQLMIVNFMLIIKIRGAMKSGQSDPL